MAVTMAHSLLSGLLNHPAAVNAGVTVDDTPRQAVDKVIGMARAAGFDPDTIKKLEEAYTRALAMIELKIERQGKVDG